MQDTQKPGTPGNGFDRDELNLEKNRISGISIEHEEPKTRPALDKKPIIILSSIAAFLIILILVLTQFVFKKPSGFLSPGDTTGSTFEGISREGALTSDHPGIQRGKESYARGYLADATTEFTGVVESDAADRDKAIALTYLGMISDDRGEYDKAVEFFNRALRYDDTNPDIHKNLSLALRHKKDMEGALEAAQRSVTLGANDPDSRLLLGNIYSESGRYDEAIGAYRDVLEKAPDNPRAHYNLGWALLKKGDEFAAAEHFKKAATVDRIGEVAHRSYSRLGVMQLERGNLGEAEQYLKEAVTIRPGDAVNHYNLGIAYLRQKKTAEAAEEFARAEEMGRGDNALLERIGEEYLAMKDYDRSLNIFERIRKGNERNVKILSQIARIHYEKGELDSAYDAYRRITEIEPATENARVAYLNMGIILDDAQRFDEAIDAYRKALAISPKDDAAYYDLGIAYKNAGKPELAITSWKKAAELNPDKHAAPLAIADYYYERGFNDLAEEEYRRIVGKWPRIQEPHFKMATMYYKRGNYDYAMSAYGRVIELDPNSDLARRALINRAILTSKTGPGEEALDRSMNEIQKALLMKPGDPEALFALGIIQMKREMYDSAIDTFFQVVKGTPDNKLVADAYNHIGKSYYKKRMYRKALQAFTRGVEEDPGNEEIRLNRRAATQAYEAELSRE